MSIIKIKRRVDLIIRPYHIAKAVKQRWAGDDTVSPPIQKAPKETILDLGDDFCGTYGQIDTIELNDKPRAPRLATEDDRPLTPEEKSARKKFFAEMREKLPFLIKKVGSSVSLTRSGLNEYRQKFDKDFKVPEGTIIIEDM